MKAISPWLLNFVRQLDSHKFRPVFERDLSGCNYKIIVAEDSCWLIVTMEHKYRIAFRLAYSPNDHLELIDINDKNVHIVISLDSLIGNYQIVLYLPKPQEKVIRLTTKLTASAPLLFPFWPRDIIPLGLNNSKRVPEGEIKVKQVGTRSGQLYFSLTKPNSLSVLYIQNLTSLEDYNQDTETSAGDTVGGEWPEIGFALPPTLKNKPLQAGKTYTLNDAFIALSEEVPLNEPAMARQYLDLLADIYLRLPLPATTYKNWPDVLNNGLKDLQENPGCWSQVDGNRYVNAYVSDYKTPPEIMVQLAVLLPLLDYVEWSNKDLEIMKKLKAGLPAFYNEQIGSIMRWHPKVADTMEGEEEHKKPLIMDSWYLQHPLLNLSRLALKGDKLAEKLFLDSLEFAIKVAHHFNYRWPVFYKMDTLEVIKAETQPGKGGEKDVPGLYAHVLLQAWELTGRKRYLAEAEKAALKLRGVGFELFYQANNTAFSAGAMLRLYQITKKEVYLDLSYLCLANVMKNASLWDCNYGYGKNFPNFFALFPLNDAPYTAAYEEQEVFCAFHDYLHHARDNDILPSVRLLLGEYIRFLVDRAVYYYPTMLPKEMLSDEVKTGEVDANLWIALEDMHDGWEKSGAVGQEVYGAGNAFGILPRHYMHVEGQPFMIYVDYPTYGFSAHKRRPVNFRLAGDGRLMSRVMLVRSGKEKMPVFTVTLKGCLEKIKGKKTKGGHLEFFVPGDSHIHIDWE